MLLIPGGLIPGLIIIFLGLFVPPLQRPRDTNVYALNRFIVITNNE